MQRVGGLSGAPAFLRELGVDPQAACAGLSFTPEHLTPDAVIPYGEALQFVENCARLSGLDHFGLRLGSRNDHLSLGAIGQLMQASPTLGDALRWYTHVQIGLSRGAAVYLYPIGEAVILGYGIYDRHQAGAEQAYGYAMAVGVNLVRALTGGRAHVREVLLCHRPPQEAGPYEHTLRTNVKFDQYQSCLVFPRADLKLPNPHADEPRYQALCAQIAQLLRIDAADPAAVLLHRMKSFLLQDAYSLAAAARRLDMHPRTLNRRLLEAGSSFAVIRDEVRFRVAQELLALTDLPVGDIGSALSFAGHSGFVRAFRRWAGETPTQWRARISRHAPPAGAPAARTSEVGASV